MTNHSSPREAPSRQAVDSDKLMAQARDLIASVNAALEKTAVAYQQAGASPEEIMAAQSGPDLAAARQELLARYLQKHQPEPPAPTTITREAEEAISPQKILGPSRLVRRPRLGRAMV